MTHIKLPLTINEHRTVLDGDGNTLLLEGVALTGGYRGGDHGIKDRMDFVVKAVNSHNDLLETLKEIVDYRGGADNVLEDEYVMDRVYAAIAKAES